MTTWIKLLKYWKAALIGLVIGYIGFLNVRLWYKGLDLGVTSIYSYKPALYFAEYTKRWKKSKVETFPCVKVQGVKVAPKEGHSDIMPNNAQTASGQSPSAFSLDSIELGEWQLKRLPYGGVAQAQLDKEGVTHLVVTGSSPRFFEIGKARSLGLSVNYSLLSGNQALGCALFLEQDLLRVGPVWLQGKVSAGTMNHSGTNDLDLSVQLNAEVRF
jgi:hypothetical protein